MSSVKLGSPVQESGSESISNVEKVSPEEFDTGGGIPNKENLQLMKVDAAVSRESTIDGNGEKSVPVF